LFAQREIAESLAFRGGTALYKLHLTPAARSSEDIDLVQTRPDAIGSVLDSIHAVLNPWLGAPKWKQTDGRDHGNRPTACWTIASVRHASANERMYFRLDSENLLIAGNVEHRSVATRSTTRSPQRPVACRSRISGGRPERHR
jgi:hypothetical protein